jgi:SepF-like predicted cell division protein (DUF552 family)
LNLPSEETTIPAANDQGNSTYHDLEKMYPDAPVPKVVDGLVIHRATLHDLTGVLQLMDWIADGEAAIVRMEKLLNRKLELQTAIEKLNKFVENDLGGQIIRLTETRLMLLPPGCRGVNGVESEAFAAEASEFN